MSDLRQIARELGVSDGQLLQLAREAAQDCALVSVDSLTESEAGDILYSLEVATTRETVAA
jgi:hypothetical protein